MTGNGADDYRHLALLIGPSGKAVFVPLEAADLDAATGLLSITVRANSEESGHISMMGSQQGRRCGVAFKLTGVLADVAPPKQSIMGNVERWTIEGKAVPREALVGSLEMGYQNLTVEHLATLRARRLLLGEEPVGLTQLRQDEWNREMFELFLRGWESPVKITESPFPAIFRDFGDRPDLFVAAAKLVAVFLLRTSVTVDHILKLDLKLRGRTLDIEFEGVRNRRYVNASDHVVAIKGECALG